MKKLNWMVIGLAVLGMATVASSAHAQLQLPKPVPTKPVPNCTIPKIDGDKVPFPLRSANTRFELAENETYILNGYVVSQSGKTYFQVDFESQPWLATSKRMQFPYFAVSANDAIQMKTAALNDLVQVAVVVRKADVSTQGQEWNSNMVLDVITKPISVNGNR